MKKLSRQTGYQQYEQEVMSYLAISPVRPTPNFRQTGSNHTSLRKQIELAVLNHTISMLTSLRCAGKALHSLGQYQADLQISLRRIAQNYKSHWHENQHQRIGELAVLGFFALAIGFLISFTI